MPITGQKQMVRIGHTLLILLILALTSRPALPGDLEYRRRRGFTGRWFRRQQSERPKTLAGPTSTLLSPPSGCLQTEGSVVALTEHNLEAHGAGSRCGGFFGAMGAKSISYGYQFTRSVEADSAGPGPCDARVYRSNILVSHAFEDEVAESLCKADPGSDFCENSCRLPKFQRVREKERRCPEF